MNVIYSSLKKQLLGLFVLLIIPFAARSQYCTSGLYCYACYYSDYINSVSTTGGTTNISNLSSGCNNSSTGYTFFSSQTVTVIQGGTVGYTIVNNPSWSEYYKMWVDFNADGDFLDAGEELMSTSLGNSSSSTNSYTSSFTVPLATTPGTKRLRVRCAYGGSSSMTACSYHGGGEVEDYVLVVTPACTTPPAPTATTPVNGCTGQTASLTATASSGTLKWYAASTGGTSLATGSPFVTPALTGNTTYYVAAENGLCASTRVAVSVVANPTPSITSQPANTVTCPGNNSSFSVTATGAGAYQWQYNTGSGYVNVPAAAPYSNVTSATLNITGATISQNGYLFRCVISSGSCSTTSNPASLTVSATPSISSQSGDDTICAEDTASFFVVSTGGTLSYQWQVNQGSGFVPLTAAPPYYGVATNTLKIANGTPSMTGYQYRCFVAIAACPAAGINSTPAMLTVKPKPAITSEPADDSVNAGVNTSFTINATGLNLKYQWQLNDTGTGYTDLFDNFVYSGTKTNTLHISNTYQSKNGFRYRCLVSGECQVGADTSRVALLKVGPPLSVNGIAGSKYGISIYPNPVTGNDMILKIDKPVATNMAVRILDQFGRVIKAESFQLSASNEAHVNVNKLASGIYTIQLCDEKYQVLESVLFNRQ